MFFHQAHGLANYCKACQPESRTYERLVYDIEDDWYGGHHPLTFSEHKELLQKHRNQLKKYREIVKEDFAKLSVYDSRLDADSIFAPKNISEALAFAKKVFAVSKKSTENFLQISKSIISSSVEILQTYGMKEPCNFIVVALGSAARSEVTPYSDLEYAFIVEDNPGHEYFRRLAIDTYFRIGNVLESPLKIFDVSEVKSNTILKTIASKNLAAGFRIDGIMPIAGNIPTGLVDDRSFTMTVDEFMTVYELSATYPLDDEKSGDKAEMFSSTVVVYANKENSLRLYEEVQKRRIQYESTKARFDQTFKEKRLQSFLRDLRNYAFLPEFVQYQPPRNLNVKVKADLFRYPTLLANNIKICMAFTSANSWEVYLELKNKQLLSEQNCNYLIIVLALSMYIRTSAYIAEGTQVSSISINQHSEPSTSGLYRIPLNLFLILGCLLMPIKRSILLVIGNADLTSYAQDLKTFVEVLTKSIRVDDSDFMLKAEVRYFAGDYFNALNDIASAVGAKQKPLDYKDFSKKLNELSEHWQTGRRKCVELCSYLLYFTHNYSYAIGYFQKLNEDDQEKSVIWQLLIAHCMKEMGKYEDVAALLKKVHIDI